MEGKSRNISPEVLYIIIACFVALILIQAFGIVPLLGIALSIVALWFIWKKSKFNQKRKMQFTGVIVGILALGCGAVAYASRTPSLSITSPETGTSIQAKTVSIEGKVSPSSSQITVNGSVVATTNGSFNYEFHLDNSVESNSIAIEVKNGNKTVGKTLTVNRIFTDEEKTAIQQAKLKAQQEQDAQIAKQKADQAAYDRSPAGRLCKKHTDWSQSDCESVAGNEIWIGMSLDMLKAERGLPNDVNQSNYGAGIQYQWCWTDYTPSCFYGGVSTIITSYN